MSDKHDFRNLIAILVIASVVFIFLMIIVFIIMAYRHNLKQNEFQTKIIELKESFQNSLLQAQLEIQEQAFANISREIHDNIGQKLSLSKLYLSTLNYSDIYSIVEKTQTVSIILGESIDSLSNIARSVSSEIVNANGLIGALEHEVSLINRSEFIHAALDVTGQTVFLPTNHELLIFRVIQEAITNILKHAKARSVNIELHYGSNNLLEVKIEDDGNGFQQKETEKHSGIGLHNMEKRCKMLNGNFSCTSEPGKGTIISLQIPLVSNEPTL